MKKTLQDTEEWKRPNSGERPRCGVVWCGVVWCGVVGWGVVGLLLAVACICMLGGGSAGERWGPWHDARPGASVEVEAYSGCGCVRLGLG
jgi:hypothetical protein